MKCIAFQAQEDLKAADNDYHSANPAYEWVCFKAHQAAEKALKAAQFSVDAVASFSHDLPSLAATIEDQELRSLAIKLQVRNYDLFTRDLFVRLSFRNYKKTYLLWSGQSV